MKSILFAVLLTLGSVVHASETADITKAQNIIKNGNEPALYVKAFEARGLKCEAVKDEGIKLGKIDQDRIATATVTVYCNEYDKNGAPMANVYLLQFEGTVYVDADFFNIDSMVVLPQE